MKRMLMAFHVITGASGGGKSTLVAALAARGVQVQPEVGRQIVQEALATGADVLPWDNPIGFRDACFRRSVAAFDHWVGIGGTVVSDRSFMEPLAFCRRAGLPVPDWMAKAARARRFARTVFVCPPWPEIYVQDTERQHGFEDGVREYEVLLPTYRDAGYDLLEVPQVSVADRADFVLSTLEHGLDPQQPDQ